MYSSVASNIEILNRHPSELQIRKINEIIGLISQIEDSQLLGVISDSELISIAGIENNMELITAFLNLITNKLTNEIISSRNRILSYTDIPQELVDQSTIDQYREANAIHQDINRIVNDWNAAKFKILEILNYSYDYTDVQKTNAGIEVKGGLVVRSIAAGVRKFIEHSTSERGINGSVNLKILAKRLNLQVYTLVEYLLHEGIIDYPYQAVAIVWDESMINFVRRASQIASMTLQEKRDEFRNNSSIYKKIKDRRIANGILYTNNIESEGDYIYSADSIFDLMVGLNLTSSGYLSQFKRDFKVRLDLWESLDFNDVIIGGSRNREELRFTKSGVLKIINWYKPLENSPYTDAIFDNRIEVEESRRSSEYNLFVTNERLAKKLQDHLVFVNEGNQPGQPSTSLVLDVLRDISNQSFDSTKIGISDEMVDTVSADNTIIEFLRVLISPNTNLDELEIKYGDLEAFRYLISIFQALKLQDEDLRFQSYKMVIKIFQALYPQRFDDIFFN